MFDLEHLILFGLPENKLEWFDDGVRCCLPFPTREHAEAVFVRCAESLARWQGVDAPIEREGERWRAEANDYKLELLARMVEVRLPMDGAAVFEFMHHHWSPDRWPRPEGTPPGRGSYYLQWSDAKMHVAICLGSLAHRTGGRSSSLVDVSLGDYANVQPEGLYYRPGRQDYLVEDYYVGAPDLVVEVMAPSTAADIRGPRAALYARAGIPFFWVSVPETDTVETWALEDGRYRMTAAYRDGEQFHHPLFPGCEIEVNSLLDSQLRRLDQRAEESEGGRKKSRRSRSEGSDDEEASRAEEEDDKPEWTADPNLPIPIHNVLLAGHLIRRYEVIDGRGPSIVAFSSEGLAKQRFREWVEEISRWEGAPVTVADGRAVSPRFELRQEGPRVAVDVITSVADYREILGIYFDHDIWEEYHQALERIEGEDEGMTG